MWEITVLLPAAIVVMTDTTFVFRSGTVLRTFMGAIGSNLMTKPTAFEDSRVLKLATDVQRLVMHVKHRLLFRMAKNEGHL